MWVTKLMQDSHLNNHATKKQENSSYHVPQTRLSAHHVSNNSIYKVVTTSPDDRIGKKFTVTNHFWLCVYAILTLIYEVCLKSNRPGCVAWVMGEWGISRLCFCLKWYIGSILYFFHFVNTISFLNYEHWGTNKPEIFNPVEEYSVTNTENEPASVSHNIHTCFWVTEEVQRRERACGKTQGVGSLKQSELIVGWRFKWSKVSRTRKKTMFGRLSPKIRHVQGAKAKLGIF